MPTTTIQSDVYVNGNLAAKTQQIASASIGDTQVQAAANIDAYKLRHLHRRGYSQASGTSATSESRVIHEALNTGTVTDFKAGAVTIPVGNDFVTVDLKKNGTTVLSAVVNVVNTFTNRVSQAATIASPSYVAGDVFEVVLTATHNTGTLPQEVFCTANFNEQSTG